MGGIDGTQAPKPGNHAGNLTTEIRANSDSKARRVAVRRSVAGMMAVDAVVRAQLAPLPSRRTAYEVAAAADASAYKNLSRTVVTLGTEEYNGPVAQHHAGIGNDSSGALS